MQECIHVIMTTLIMLVPAAAALLYMPWCSTFEEKVYEIDLVSGQAATHP